jgi:hypothetical protein
MSKRKSKSRIGRGTAALTARRATQGAAPGPAQDGDRHEPFDALLAGPDTLVQDVLQERAQTCAAEFADLLLPALPMAPDEMLYEFAVLFFARAKGDYAARVYAAALATTDAYGLSLLCMLLGRIDRGEVALPFVWNAYHHLAAVLGPPLDQGALRGLIRYAERRQGSRAQSGAGGTQA